MAAPSASKAAPSASKVSPADDDSGEDELEREMLRLERERQREAKLAGRVSEREREAKERAAKDGRGGPAAGLPSRTPARANSSAPRTPRSVVGLSLEVLEQGKATWAANVEKISQNKINARNAWNAQGMEQLPIVARELVQQGDFHTGSVVVESAAKIFAYRVDALGTQSDQVQAAIRRGDAGKEQQAPAGVPGEEAEGEEGQQRAKRKRQPQANTLAVAAELDHKDSERTFEVDPLFAVTSSRFDQGGPKGLLLNNCPVGPYINVQLDTSTAQGIFHTIVPPEIDASSGQGGGADGGAADLLQRLQDEDAGVLDAPEADATFQAEAAKAQQDVEQELKELQQQQQDAQGQGGAVDGQPGDGTAVGPDGDAVMDDGAGGDGETFEIPDGLGVGELIADPAAEDQDQEQGMLGAAAAVQRADQRLGDVDQRPPDDDDHGGMDQDDGGDDDSRSDCSRSTEVSVSSRLGFGDDDKEELIRLHQGPTGRQSTWQGPYDCHRWKLLRQSQAAALQGDRAGTGIREKPKRQEQGEIDFGLNWTPEETPQKLQELEALFKKAKSADSLLLQRGKERRAWELECSEGGYDARRYPLKLNYLDSAVIGQCRKENRIVQPDDHRITTDWFFQLHCLKGPQWNLLNKWKKQRRNMGRPTCGTYFGRPVTPAQQRAGQLPDNWDNFPENYDPNDPDGAPGSPTGSGGGGDAGGDDDDDDVAGDGGWGCELNFGNIDACPDFGEDGLPLPRDSQGERDLLAQQAGVALGDRPEGEVAQLKVAFARQSKVVDIKRLKDTMWRCMLRNSDDAEPQAKRRKGPDGRVYAIDRQTFSSLVIRMQPAVRASRIAANVSDISISFYFICLLHLCNDHNLRIEQTPLLDDCHIIPQ